MASFGKKCKNHLKKQQIGFIKFAKTTIMSKRKQLPRMLYSQGPALKDMA